MSYTARAERSGKYWAVHVPEIDRWTQARKVTEVEEMARDLIALSVDIQPTSFRLQVIVVLPDAIARQWEHADELEQQGREVMKESAREARRAVQALVRDEGMSQTEVATALDISKQRVSQLING